MPARRLLPFLTLAVAAACGRSVDSTGTPAAWAGRVLVSGDTAGHVALWDVGDLVEAR